VDLMGGTIEVITAPGSGTEILIRLKLQLAEEKDVPEAGKSGETGEETGGPSIDFSTKRLLLVEDNMVNMEIASMILTQAGFTVETAENGKIAVDMMTGSEPGYYDAVLMDIQMPVMDGYEATRIIRALPDSTLSQVPILAMTANAFKEDEEAAKEAGMQAHIAKPVDINAMMKTLTDVLLEAERKKDS
jgi:CheY-like chemotaxis protein